MYFEDLIYTDWQTHLKIPENHFKDSVPFIRPKRSRGAGAPHPLLWEHGRYSLFGQIVQRAPTYVVFSVLRIDFPFQDGVHVSRDPGGNLLPLHLVVRRCRQRRPSLVRTEPRVTVYLPSHQGWTGMNFGGGGQLNPLRPFCFAGEILHGWKLTLPSQQATSYLVRQTRWAALVKVTPSSKYSNPRSAPVTRLSSTLCFPDLLLIFYYWKAIGDKFFVIHHVAALYAYYYVLVSALLSNSRTCRQDGKETTKSEQLRPPTLGVPF